MEKNYLLILKSLVFIWHFCLEKTKDLSLFRKQPNLSRYTLVTCFFFFTVLVQSQTIKYVTVNGSGSKDGSSWTNASDNLQKVISSSDSGTQIWIARGTYTPKVALAPNNSTQDRNNTFGLKKGVQLYGGFIGNETNLSQRNITANETILSGNLGGGNYAHHVILIYALEENENYYLNGLTISDGRADIWDFYKISTETKGNSINDNIKDKYPDWYVSMTESPYYNYASFGLQLAGFSALPGIPSVPGGDMTITEILNTSYPKSNGGAIYNIKGALTLENVTFKNNKGIVGAAICLQEGAHTTLNNCTFTNNIATDNGGAINSSASYLTITGGNFNNNSAPLGGAISDLDGKLLNLSNVTFSNNLANKIKTGTGYGGAIYIEKVSQDNSSSRIVNNCTFDNNSADVAGAIYADENIRNLKITNSAFTGNNALMEASTTIAGGGGAIMLRKVINAELTSNNFSNNKALKSIGGGTFIVQTNGITFSGNTFSGNSSLLGGAMCLLENKSTTTLNGNTFTGNSVTDISSYSVSGFGGAIVSANDNNIKISDNIFTGNTASKFGGAINFETITVNSVINNNTFNTNTATKFGGAIYANAIGDNVTAKVTINNNNFESNNAVERGGGILLANVIAADIHTNSFVGNKSNVGAVLDVETYKKSQFFNNTVKNNVGTLDSNGQSGCIIAVIEGVNTFYNNVFTGNESFTAVFYDNSTVDFINNTVWNEKPGYSIYTFSKKVKLYNNILEELNGSNTSADVQNNSFRYDNQNKFVNKNNNIRETNPYFADAANYNFNLTGCSSIINKGNNSLYTSEYPNTDFAGKNRKVSTIDIGAYENELGASGKTIPTVVAAQSFCNEAIVNDLKATGSNIKWYSQAVGGSPLASNTALVSGNTYYASQTVNSCESDRASVTVSISSTEPPTAQTPQNFIIGQSGAKIIVNGSNLKWYTQEKDGTALTAVPSLNMSSENSATYWVSQTNANNCESVRTKIVVNVTKIPLTIKAINKVKVFDGNVYGNTNYTVTYSGFEPGDSQSNSISGTLAFSGDAATATEPGIYKIIPQGITSTKYTVLYEEGTLEIKSNLILNDNILYVKQNGNGDGTSWNSALSNLEVALTRASNINSVHTDDNDPKKVKKIFVAKGTYQPASGKSFIMPKNIEIYGGFDPDNAITNLTHQRITGNLNDGSILRGNNASVIKNDGNGLTNNALLNGFTITNGNAANGGGIYNKNVTARFENCIIRANNAATNGGAVYNESANTTWINCLIINNTAPNGASMYNNASLPTLLNATIADNTGAQGAALYNANGSSARIVNTISVKNSSDIVNNASNPSYENSLIQGIGGVTGTTAVFDANYSLSTTSAALNTGKNNPASIVLPAKDLKGKSRIIDTTVDMGAFERNKIQTITAAAITKKYGDEPFTHGTASSGLPLEYTSSNNNAVATIENGKIKILNVGTATITVNQPGNTAEYDAVSGSFLLTVDKGVLTVSADNKVKIQDGAKFNGFTVSYSGFVFADTPDNSLTGTLTYGGTAVDATNIGTNYTIIPLGYASSKYNITYTNGNLRIEPDITLTDGTLYVKKGATGNGTSWNNALGEVRDALEIARIINSSTSATKATKMFVSVGQYTSVDNKSFYMLKGVNMYGGFDPDKGVTTLSHKRKFAETILVQGARGNRVIENNDNGLTNTDIIDGFTIGGSSANIAYEGGGIYNKNSSPTIVNCIIKDNSLFPFPYYLNRTYGGGIYNDNSNPVLINCIITNNKVGVDGNEAGNAGYYGYGSAMYSVNNSNPKLYNCTITDNRSISGNNGDAPAIVNLTNSVTSLYNSIYMNNNKGVSSGIVSYNSIVQKDDNITEGIYNNGATVTFDAIFKTNTRALREDSYAKDKGSNSHYTFNSLSTYDINGYSRLSGTIDVGAEELRTVQNITADDVAKIYGDSDFIHPSATVSSGLPLTYTKSSNVNVAVIKEGKIQILNTGTSTITITQVGNGSYAPTEKTFVLTVAKATLTVKATDKTKFANNLAMPTADYDVNFIGFVNGDDRTKLTGSITYSGDAIGKTEVGIYTNGIVPGGLSSNNYSFIYTAGTLKIVPNTKLTNNILYVKQGTVGGDGSTWELALNDLSLALRYATILNNNTPNTVNKIYVAKGTYTPKYSARDNSNFIDEGRDNSFLLLDGVKLYGGFDGNISDESLNDRRIQENKTILDGQSLINHIITVSNSAGSNEIDGFSIVKGAAASAAHSTEGTVTINGKAITREYGGGIRVHSSNLIVKNCILSENTSGFRAGGMYVTDNSNVSVYNTLFYSNSAYHAGATGTSIGVNAANVKIVNTTFGDDITNASHLFTIGASNLEVFNAAFRDTPGNNDINREGGTVTIKNSLLSKAQSLYTSMTLANNFYAQPADFVDANAFNFALKPTSVAVNKGDNTLYETVIGGNKDIAGNTRFQNTTIDMGCYESKIMQTITADDITKKYTDADFVVGTASSGLSPLTYSSGNTNVASITKDNKIHIVGVGQATITVVQNGDEIYAPATKTFKLTVGKGDFSATLQPETYTYDGAAKYLNVSALPAGATVSYEGNGQINAGDYTVKAIINGGEYYNDITLSNTLKINKKNLSGISFPSNTFTYDGFDKHPEVSGILPEGLSVVYSNTQKNAGVYNNVKATISGSNYNTLELTTSMTINKTDLPSGIFLLEKEEVYDGTPKRLSLDGILPDGVTVTYANNDNINVGSYNVTVNINGGINYNNKQLIAKLTIVKGNLTDNFVLASSTFTYDGSEKSLAIQGSLPSQVSVSYTNNNKIEVGTYRVYAVLSKPNYNDKVVEADLIIEPKTINAVVQGTISKVYNANAVIALNANNFALEGVVDGDNVLVDNPAAGDLDNKNVGVNKQVTINNLKLSGTASKNYVLSATTLVANIAEVKLKEIEVSLKGSATKMFDGTTDAVLTASNFELKGIEANENVTVSNSSSGVYDTKNVGTNKTITVENLTISGNDVSNYILNSQTVSGQIGEITSKTITVTADASQSKVYGAVEPALSYTVTPALVTGDSFTGTLERIAGENIGTYKIVQGTLSAGTNYSLTYVANDFKITAKPITVTVDVSQTKVYGTTDPVLTYSVSPSLVGNDAFSGVLQRIRGENVGTYGIEQGTLTAGTNYAITYIGKDFVITAKTITVTADSQTKVYGENDAALTYSFTPALKSGDAFTGTLSRVSGENIGDYAITKGSLSAGSNYSINYVGEDYTITPKPITVTTNASQTKVYGTTDPTFSYSVSPALVGNDTFTGALSREVGQNIGTYAIKQGNLSAGANYTITFESKDFEITPKEITVTANALQTKVYGDTDPVFTYTSSEALVTGDTFSGSLSRANGENVGTYSYSIGSLTAGSNYVVTLVGSNAFAVTAKPITVTADAFQTKVYGTTDPVLTYSVSPSLVGNDIFSGVLERAIGENVGTYLIRKGTLTAGNNYAITYTGEDFEITAKTIAVTADSQTKGYGENDAALTYSFTPALENGDSFKGTLSRIAGENVGIYAIGQGTLSAGSNYAINYTGKDYTITAKPITVTANASQKKVYGTTDPVLTYAVSPALVGNDTFTGALERTIGENVGSYVIKQGDLNAGSNYTMTFESKDFEITPREITVKADASQAKVYGDADSVFTYTSSETLLTGNTFTGNLSRANGENVGTYTYAIGSLTAGSNYVVTLIGSNAFAITAKPITVTADASQTKVYGTVDPALTYSVSPGLVRNDTFSGVLKRAIGENTGTYAIGQGTLTAGNNYTITYNGKDFEITKADQVITWNQTLVSNCEGATTSVLTATSNSGLPISYASSNENVVTISNDELIFNNPGSGTVSASQAGNNNYNAAETIVLPVLNSQPNLIKQQFDNVIFFDNSSKEFKSYTWYKDGILVAGQTLQYYKEVGGLNGTYYAVATKLDGTVITSCPLTISSKGTVETIRIYPNPVKPNASYQLITSLDAAKMINAHVEVFGISGSLVDQKTTNENETTLLAPAVEGIYIVRITLANGKTFTKNLLVKN
ncbi:MBG domain-containing protein [Flavobacterium phragmitis]|uniref:Right handed beta helix region n=1 Tax=Flavobacterium phragmitis TaxID=739143 RepID=A0A1I1WVR8_9FLAO|nr:MBG domain-containing protein [Flavobacterium phragmitis]SFD99284.1 Right handed beta helix region [Flavobacterium phragmitis]